MIVKEQTSRGLEVLQYSPQRANTDYKKVSFIDGKTNPLEKKWFLCFVRLFRSPLASVTTVITLPGVHKMYLQYSMKTETQNI